jgi:hypothetical protein
MALWATLAGGLALVASAPLSYNNSADFSRYLPRAIRPTAVAWWTTLGAFAPIIVFTALGALAGTALDMTDPQTALDGIMPAWVRPAFLLAVILGAVANNAMTAYSSGLALKAVGSASAAAQCGHRRHSRRGHDPVRAARLQLPGHHEQHPPGHGGAARPQHGHLRRGRPVLCAATATTAAP